MVDVQGLNSITTKKKPTGYSHRNHEILDISKVNEPIKILSIFFTYDQLKSKELNSKLTLKSIRRSLSCWQWRNLTLISKI